MKRKSCRAVLLTPSKEILLIKIHNPVGRWSGWITPGGGIEEGETESMALRRELKEELGFESVQNEIKIWTRFHCFPWNEMSVEQEEVFYLISTDKFTPVATQPLSGTEMLDFAEMRWWSFEEVRSSHESYSPASLPLLLEKLITEGPPKIPFDAGI